MPGKPRKPSQRTKAKKRKTAPSGDAAWPARSVGRRQVLKGVVAGSGVVASAMSLPKEWTKPVVQSIMASAQAQVSPVPLTPAPLPAPVPIPLAPIPIPIPIAPVPIPNPLGPTAPNPVPPVPSAIPNPIIAPVPIFAPPDIL